MHYILATLIVSADATIPPVDSRPIDRANATDVLQRAWINETCCWIPLDSWSHNEAVHRLHHSLTQQFIHHAVDKLLDEVRSGSLPSFQLTQFISSIVQWLEETWKHADRFLQILQPHNDNEKIQLSPTLFDHLPLMDPSRCAQAFVECWNGIIVPKLRHQWEMSGRMADVSDIRDPRDWLVQTWPWNTMMDLAEKSKELLPVISPLLTSAP